MRYGFLPALFESKVGLSAITVLLEVRIASELARSLATSPLDRSDVIHLELLSLAATLPSKVLAIFQINLALPFSILVSQARLACAASSASNPNETFIPAAINFCAPPAATGFGSVTAKTTFLIPDSIIASMHGGVLPK